MDVYCPICAEPCDFHEFDTPRERQLYITEGCEAIGWKHGTMQTPPTSAAYGGLDVRDAQAALVELLGDDVDGIAAMLDDAGFAA